MPGAVRTKGEGLFHTGMALSRSVGACCSPASLLCLFAGLHGSPRRAGMSLPHALSRDSGDYDGGQGHEQLAAVGRRQRQAGKRGMCGGECEMVMMGGGVGLPRVLGEMGQSQDSAIPPHAV